MIVVGAAAPSWYATKILPLSGSEVIEGQTSPAAVSATGTGVLQFRPPFEERVNMTSSFPSSFVW